MGKKQQQEKPSIVNKSPQDIEELIKKVQQSGLDDEAKDLLINCVEFSTWMPAALQEKDVSISNLRRTLFGEPSKKSKKKSKDDDKDNASGGDKESGDEGASSEVTEDSTQPLPADNNKNSQGEGTVIDLDSQRDKKGKGHGRLSHKDYPDAIDTIISVAGLRPGDPCPSGCGGKLYELKVPSIVIRVTGNTFATVNKYHRQRLRCSLCLEVTTASLPNEVSENEKYDTRFKAQLALQKYYVAVPFHRQAVFQRMMNFPLPPSTQFELCEDVANCAYPVIRALEVRAANGKLVHNDDTKARILSVIEDNTNNPDKKRTGMFTTGIIAKTKDERTIALYYTGTKHAGENLDDILKYRQEQREKLLQMCDALSANMPKALKTILCNCLAHGFRKFRDLLDFYPEACLHVMTELSKVYKNDEQTKNMSDDDRLRYHRQHSKTIMLDLNSWLKRQLREKLVEPNSALGKAIKYMLNHWKKLRRFLTTPGAPIDNNIVERALKIPINVRKAAMFYKTEHGACVASILTSLIVTAALADENPVEYLIALQENKQDVFADPDAWVPWRYRETLKNKAFDIAA